MHLAILVVGHGVLLQPLLHYLVSYHHLVGSVGLYHKLKYVEQLACVAPAVAQHGGGLLQGDVSLGELHVLGYGALEQAKQVVLLQGLEHIELAAREQGPDHLERGVLGGGSDERHHSALYGSEQRVLLRLGESVNLVDEEYWRG